MNGARQLAHKALSESVRPGDRVIDVCCGDCWARQRVIEIGAEWHGVDNRRPPASVPYFRQADLAQWSSWSNAWGSQHFDVAVTLWGMQHLMGREAVAWVGVHQVLRQGGPFVYVGRHRTHPTRETNRQDPLNGYDHRGVTALAIATGFDVVRFETFQYTSDAFSQCGEEQANAFIAMMRRL